MRDDLRRVRGPRDTGGRGRCRACVPAGAALALRMCSATLVGGTEKGAAQKKRSAAAHDDGVGAITLLGKLLLL